MSPAEPAAPVRLDLDVAAVRGVGRLRLVAAVVVLPASVAFGLGGETFHLLVAALGVLVSLGWIAAFTHGRRVAKDAENRYLELGAEGLTRVEGAKVESLAWSEIAAIRVDEDRLVVVVERRAGEPWKLEPIWGGLGAYDLRERLQDANDGARRADDG